MNKGFLGRVRVGKGGGFTARTEIKGWYLHDDVKEFIKQIKEQILPNEARLIDKLAGDGLI